MIFESKRERGALEEGADHLRASSQATQGHADAVFQSLPVGWTLARQGIAFHPTPESFVGVQFRGVGGEAISAQSLPVGGQGGASLLRAMRVQSVPEQKDLTGDVAQQVADKVDEFGAADGAAHQAQIGVWVGGHRGEGRQLGPVEAVPENRRATARCPGLARRGQQREPAFVEKNQRGLQRLRVFFIRGQVCCTQRWMAASSRSRARRAGFCQLQPKRCNRRQT